LSGVRWTTGIGIAIGGVGGAIAALLGAPKAPTPAAHVVEPIASASAAPAVRSAAAAALSAPAPAEAGPTPAMTASAPTAVAVVAPSAIAPAPSAAPAPAAVGTAPLLEPATTRDALLKSEMLCDQKQDFDECERAAESLEKGTIGPADAEQAKRFRRIALTHLVKQCEGGSPHACFVMAGKYRAGSELTTNPTSAEALEKRGLELCRNRAAAECPSP